jgi:hypothetical protein
LNISESTLISLVVEKTLLVYNVRGVIFVGNLTPTGANQALGNFSNSDYF